MSREPPLRLRDDPAVGRALREDLARAAGGAGAPYDVAAGLSRYEEALRAGVGQGAAGGGKTVLGAALKGALLGLAVVGVAVLVGDRTPSSPVARVEAPPSVASAAVAAPRRSTVPTESPVSPVSPGLVREAEPAKPSLTAAPVAKPGASGAAAEPATAAPAPDPAASSEREAAPGGAGAPRSDAPDALAAETAHLARLRTIQGGDPAQALALAAEGNQRFPGGFLRQERESVAIDALVRLGRLSEARARAGAFLAAYPRSVFRERMTKLTEHDHGPRARTPLASAPGGEGPAGARP